MSLTNSVKNAVASVTAEVPEAAPVEAGATGTEALALTAADWADHIDLEYGSSAEDNGTAGVADGQPGLVYTGAAPTAVQVSVADLDAIEAIITPATGTFTLALLKNSEVYAYADEGFVTQDEITTWEFNASTYMDLVQNDVIRVAFVFDSATGEADLTAEPGRIVIV